MEILIRVTLGTRRESGILLVFLTRLALLEAPAQANKIKHLQVLTIIRKFVIIYNVYTIGVCMSKSIVKEVRELKPKDTASKYYGPEPLIKSQPITVEEYNSTMGKFFNWYNYFYGKKEVEVKYKGRKIRAMIYYMTDHYGYGHPSESYLNTVIEGYLENKVSVYQLNQALEELDNEYYIGN